MGQKRFSPIRKRTKRHRHSTITYLDHERLRIRFYSLVIRVSSINDRFGTVKEFVRLNRLHGITNGKLLIISEMIQPGSYLIDMAINLLPSFGMVYIKDFVYVVENLDCIHPKWLDMRITDKGHWIWCKRNITTTNTTT